jgi:hypothetical protein
MAQSAGIFCRKGLKLNHSDTFMDQQTLGNPRVGAAPMSFFPKAGTPMTTTVY